MKNWIETYQLENGDFDISDVNKELLSQIPSAIQMGKVYQRLIVDTALWNENYVDEIYRVYNSGICDIISSLTVDKLKKCHNPCKYKGCGTFICIHEI